MQHSSIWNCGYYNSNPEFHLELWDGDTLQYYYGTAFDASTLAFIKWAKLGSSGYSATSIIGGVCWMATCAERSAAEFPRRSATSANAQKRIRNAVPLTETSLIIARKLWLRKFAAGLFKESLRSPRNGFSSDAVMPLKNNMTTHEPIRLGVGQVLLGGVILFLKYPWLSAS